MKSILITGCTDGIGKLATVQLAKAGHKLILVARNEAKLKKLKDELNTQSENIQSIICDLSIIKSLQIIPEYLERHNISLDIIINNAGVFITKETKTNEGLDYRFAVNYIAPYWLTKKLLPFLDKSDDKRIINLSSAAQETVSIPALRGQTTLSTQLSYAQSKLALTMWSFDLGQKLNNTAVIPVNPGSLLNTPMVQEAYGRYWSPASKGGDILYALATGDQYSQVTGKYFDNDLGDKVGQFGQAHNDAYNPQLIAELLSATDEVLQNTIGE